MNTAEDGGAIFSDFSSLSIFSSLFIENSAERHGGGYYDDFSELYCSKTIMYKCSADNGGAIYSDYVNLDFCTIGIMRTRYALIPISRPNLVMVAV